MKITIGFLCGLCLSAGVVLPAAAQDGGWYLDLNGGIGHRNDGGDELADDTFDDGYAIGGAIGYRFHEQWNPVRLELAYNRQSNDIDRMTYLPPTGISGTEKAFGTVDAESIQQVAYYDIHLNKLLATNNPFLDSVKPYIGAGFGFTRVDIDGLSTKTLEMYTPPGNFPLNYTTKWSFSYSLRAGISFELNKQWDIYAGAYYLKVDDDVLVEAPPNEGVGNALNQAAHASLETSGMVAGLRFYF